MSKSFGTAHPAIPHLVNGPGGIPGEIKDLRADVNAAFGTMENLGSSGTSPFCLVEFTNPAAAAAAGLEVATATQITARTVTTFVAGGVAALLAYPRNVTFTTAGTTPADAPASAVVTGTDCAGAVLTETVTVAQTATIASGVKCFKTITNVVYAAGDGTDATVSIGFGPILGLPYKAKSRAGMVHVINEIAVGSKVTNGVFVAAATSLPNGSYAPNTAPNGTNDYAVLYEKDMA